MYAGIMVFCATCKRNILFATDQFKPGGPYHGGMFFPNPKYSQFDFFQTRASVTGMNLFCPCCGQCFVRRDGALLTEHGLIAKGQESLKKDFFVVHQEGVPKGTLMSASTWSKSVINIGRVGNFSPHCYGGTKPRVKKRRGRPPGKKNKKAV